MIFQDGQFYDATIIPSACGFFRNSNGKLYLRLGLMDSEGGQHVYAWWVSGKMADSLREALPHMGVNVEQIGMDFYKRASDFIQPAQCRFVVREEEYNGRVRMKIGGVFFGHRTPNDAAAGDDDAAEIHAKLFPAAEPDPMGIGAAITNDDVPW